MKSFLALSFLLALVSCKGGGDSKSTIAAGTVIEDASSVKAEHIGLWAKCENDSSEGISMLRVYNFSSKSLIASFVYYSGLDCQSSTLEYEERFVSEVTRTEDLYTTYVVGASSRSMSSADVGYNNTNSYCGFTDWQINVPKPVLDRDCAGSITKPGAGSSFALSKNGDNLVLSVEGRSPITVSPYHTPTFGHSGTAILNGEYVTYRGGKAIVYSFLDNWFGTYEIDSRSGKEYYVAGTYTISGDQITFTVNEESAPCGNLGNVYSMQYSTKDLAIVLKYGESDLAVAESFDWSPDDFSNAFTVPSSGFGCL